jgi:hypothetical protein
LACRVEWIDCIPIHPMLCLRVTADDANNVEFDQSE